MINFLIFLMAVSSAERLRMVTELLDSVLTIHAIADSALGVDTTALKFQTYVANHGGSGVSGEAVSDSCDHVRGAIRDTVNVIPITWENIQNKPSCFNACGHGHTWTEITDKPSVYPPDAHTQGISSITYLLDSLGAKLPLHGSADSLNHFGSARFTDTTRFKLDSLRMRDSLAVKSPTNHTHSGLAPAGGASAYVLKKNSATDYDYSWAVDATGGGGAAYNPGRAYQWHTIEPHDAATKYASGGANRARVINFFLSCSLRVNKIMWRGRLTATIKATDVGIYDSLGNKLWSAGSNIGTTLIAGICSTTVSPTLRLGPGDYYAAWACSSASKDTIYGVAVGVAGQMRRTGYKAACFPLPATLVPTTITHDVGCIWMCLRDN